MQHNHVPVSISVLHRPGKACLRRARRRQGRLPLVARVALWPALTAPVRGAHDTRGRDEETALPNKETGEEL